MTKEEYTKLSEEIRDANKKISEYRAHVSNLRSKSIKYQQERLSCLVGRAFKYNGTPDEGFVVSNVPRVKYALTGDWSFNPYQIPVITILNALHDGADETYIENDTVFSRAVESEDVYKAFVEDKFTEISIDEFYDMVLKAVKTRVEAIDKGLRK